MPALHTAFFCCHPLTAFLTGGEREPGHSAASYRLLLATILPGQLVLALFDASTFNMPPHYDKMALNCLTAS